MNGRRSMRLVECVPNFSEGRDPALLDAIAESIRGAPGVKLLDVDPGKSTNRTVMTFVGAPADVVEAAFRAAATAYRLIDMTRHSGEHPRLGAVDVVPFIPVSGVSMEECIDCARRFGARVGEELGVPIYLYEEAQALEHRKALRQIRQGEYEGLADRIGQPEWAPDFGPATFVARSGATVTGVRFFLIAYNVNILGTRNQAHRLALNIREQGRTVKGPGGETIREPGYFDAVKGIGWELEEFGLAQVSMNLDNYRVTPLHAVYEAIRKDAAELGVGVAGSEVVGLIPLEAVLQAADFYIEREGLFILDERQKVRLVIDRLGLSSVHAFRPEEKIIEYMIDQDADGPLIRKSVRDFVEAVGARTSTPGGGSVAALVGALGAGLGAMVGWLTYGRRKYDHLDATVRANLPALVEVQEALLRAVDADTDAFADYVKAIRMPRETEEQKVARRTAMEEGLKKATLVPLRAMETADRAWDPMLELARVGQYSSRSDLDVGAKALEACLYGAHRNVLINLADIEDHAFRAEVEERATTLMERGRRMLEEVQRQVADRTGDV
ncbi:MAG TPA: glutamate formimidoyltransferase [Longimicrobiales bacterium]|nr:glutamate formimidoyltransferase [Longimicrobiales bacterium]